MVSRPLSTGAAEYSGCMCGRYVQARAAGDLVEDLGAELEPGAPVRPSWNVGPWQQANQQPFMVEVLTEDGELQKRLRTGMFGVMKPWHSSVQEARRWATFNAKKETLLERSTWRRPLVAHRCAVPATAYYEWKKYEGGSKTTHAIRPADDGGILFAGFYESWRSPADDAWMWTFAILTGPSPVAGNNPAHDDLAWVHHRIPLALDQTTLEKWITSEELEPADATALVEEVRERSVEVAKGWEVYQVGREAGNWRNDYPELLSPVTADGADEAALRLF